MELNKTETICGPIPREDFQGFRAVRVLRVGAWVQGEARVAECPGLLWSLIETAHGRLIRDVEFRATAPEWPHLPYTSDHRTRPAVSIAKILQPFRPAGRRFSPACAIASAGLPCGPKMLVICQPEALAAIDDDQEAPGSESAQGYKSCLQARFS